MNPHDVAPMIIFTTLIVVSGGVVLLRPLARRLGDLIDVTIAERRRRLAPDDAVSADNDRMRSAVDAIDQRLRLLEERQDFTDALLSAESRVGNAQKASALQRRPLAPGD